MFISWVGLRGAAPIILALFPLLAGIPEATPILDVAFFVVLISLTVQGWTIPALARRRRLQVPPAPEPTERHDLVAVAVAVAVAAQYDLPLPEDMAGLTLEDFLAVKLRSLPVAGDRVRPGKLEFVVRTVADGHVAQVSLRIPTHLNDLP